MAAPRFFVPLDLAREAAGREIDLPESAAHHATRVLRLAVGDALMIFTGAGGEFAATLTRVDKRGASIRIESFDPIERESPLSVTLAQAIVANDAMDYAVRKAVEMGAAAIQPIASARSAPLGNAERAEKRLAHWRQIAIAACEQCGRNRIPVVRDPQPLAAWMQTWTGSAILFAPDADAGIESQGELHAPDAVMIGPEGGWTADEVAAARRRGFALARLGPRVLRAETAAVAALAAVQARWGDMR